MPIYGVIFMCVVGIIIVLAVWQGFFAQSIIKRSQKVCGYITNQTVQEYINCIGQIKRIPNQSQTWHQLRSTYKFIKEVEKGPIEQRCQSYLTGRC